MKKIKEFTILAILILIGLIILKYLPMNLFGENILFDASSHMAWTSFILYLVYTFVEKHKPLKIPYFIFCVIVLILVGVQRISVQAHNIIGLLLGLAVAVVSIYFARKIRLR